MHTCAQPIAELLARLLAEYHRKTRVSTRTSDRSRSGQVVGHLPVTSRASHVIMCSRPHGNVCLADAGSIGRASCRVPRSCVALNTQRVCSSSVRQKSAQRRLLRPHVHSPMCTRCTAPRLHRIATQKTAYCISADARRVEAAAPTAAAAAAYDRNASNAAF